MNIQQLHSSWSFLENHKVFVACSGGVDSVVMLHVLKDICRDLEVLHVNYSLRGEDSEKDEQFVRKLCIALDIPLTVKKVDTKSILKDLGGNLQEVARKIRYEFFEEQLVRKNGGFVALGQHSDDQIETFFQHLGRKSGILGMSCMLEVHQQYIRPLLHYSKLEIISFAQEQGWVWREDRSNQENKYTRNRLRNIVLPQLYTEIPTLKESVLALVGAFQFTQKTLELNAKEIHTKIQSSTSWDYEEFDSLSHELRVEVLRQLGGTFEILTQLQKIRHAQKGKKVVCGDWVFYSGINAFDIIKNLEINQVILKNFGIQITSVLELPNDFSKSVIFLDAEKVKGELVLRTWRIGDRIAPIGMKGSKLISDVLTEAKISSGARESSLVVADDMDVLWCVGHKISRKSIADENSRSILKVQIVEK